MRLLIGMLVCVGALSSCISTEEPDEVVSTPAQAPTSAPSPQGGEQHLTWPVRTNQSAGISIRIPQSWYIVWNPLRDGTLGDILVVGSMRFPHLLECEPVPRGQALVALSEFVPYGDDLPQRLERRFPPGPQRFETPVLRSSQVRKGCDQPRAALIRFREAGRFMYAWLMFGRDLATEVRTKAEAVLSTLRVVPAE